MNFKIMSNYKILLFILILICVNTSINLKAQNTGMLVEDIVQNQIEFQNIKLIAHQLSEITISQNI